MFSQTNHKNNTLGKTKVTLPGRDGGIVGQGVVQQGDGTFSPNTVNVPASSYYDNYYRSAMPRPIFSDATFLKIVKCGWSIPLPKRLLNKIGLQPVAIAVFGRDLFNFTEFPGFDPEGGNLNSGTLTPGVELMQFPSTRTMGMNVTLKF